MTDIAELIHQLRNGDDAAAQQLWEGYFGRLAQLARVRISGRTRLVEDEEDIALSALKSFCKGLEQGRFPLLKDRGDLWNVLAAITLNKALRAVRDEGRQKRGGGQVIISQNTEDSDQDLLGTIVCKAPTPDMAVQFAEDVQRLLGQLSDEDLIEVAMLKLNGDSNAEIAEKRNCAERTVERKLNLIRKIWGKGLNQNEHG